MKSALDLQLAQMQDNAVREKAAAVKAAWQMYRDLLLRRNNPREGDAVLLLDVMASLGIDQERHEKNQEAVTTMERLCKALRTSAQIAAIRAEESAGRRAGVEVFANSLGARISQFFAGVPEIERFQTAVGLADLLRRHGDCPEADALDRAATEAGRLYGRACDEERASSDAEGAIYTLVCRNHDLFTHHDGKTFIDSIAANVQDPASGA